MLNYLFLSLNLVICLYFIYKKDYAILVYIVLFQGIHLVPFNNLGYENIGYVYYIFISLLFFVRINGFSLLKIRIQWLLNNKIIWSIILITSMLLLHSVFIGLKTEEGKMLVIRYFTQVLPVMIYLIFVLDGVKQELFINQFLKGILVFGALFAFILIFTTDILNVANYQRAEIRDALGIGTIVITRIGATIYLVSLVLLFDEEFKKYLIYIYLSNGIGILLIVLGTSRGPLVSLLVTLVVYFLARRKTNLSIIIRKNSAKILFSIFAIIILVSFYNFSDIKVVNLYEKRLEALEDYKSIGRFKRYELAYDYYTNQSSFISSNFLIGAGPGGFGLQFGMGFAHNFILEILFEYGLVGLVIIIWFISTNLKYIFRLLRENIAEKFMVIPLLVFFRLVTTMFSGDLVSWRNLFFYSIILIHVYIIVITQKKKIALLQIED